MLVRSTEETDMNTIPTRHLIAWLSQPGVHHLVIAAARTELTRRGFEVRS